MKKSRFTDSQIMAILKQAEAGSPACGDGAQSCPCESYPSWHSRTMRTARCRISGENRLFLVILFTPLSKSFVSRIPVAGSVHLND